MTYSLKTALYFIFGILTLGTTIILSVTAPAFPLTSIMMFVGFGLLIAGWFRVFHQHPPAKHLSTILGSVLLTACFIFPLIGVGLLGLPTGYLYISTLVSALVGPPFMALGLRKDVTSFYEAREREEDEVINTPLLTVPVDPKNVVSVPREDFEEYLTEPHSTGKPEGFITIDHDRTLDASIDSAIIRKAANLAATPKLDKEDFDYTPQKHIHFGAGKDITITPKTHLVLYSVPQNLKATEIKVGQHISFVNNEADGTQSFPQGTVVSVKREASTWYPDDIGKIVFKLDNEFRTCVTESDDEMFRLMGHLEDGPDPLAPEPRPAIEPIEKMLEDAASEPRIWSKDDENSAESYLPRTTQPVDPLTEVLEEALTGPLPDLELNTVRPMVHVDVEDPKWDRTLTQTVESPETFVKFSRLEPGQNITFQEEHRHVFKDNREVTGTVISVNPHHDPSDLAANFMLVTIGGPDAGSYTVHRDHHAALSPETYIKFRKVKPGQTIRFTESHKHSVKNAKEVTGTVTHVKVIKNTSELLMDITIDGPDARTYPVISDHNAVLLNA